jgi:hypothetical protein
MQTTRGERVAAVCVLGLLLSSFALVPVVRALDPQLAAMAYWGHDTDPWGAPWYVHRVERTPYGAPVQTTPVYQREAAFQAPTPQGGGEVVEIFYYSLGPNGVDERGAGDDLLAEAFPQSRFPLSNKVERGRVLAPGAALALGLLLIAFRCARAPRSERSWVEVLRSAPLAAVPTLAAILFAYWDVAATASNRSTLAERLVSDRVLAPPSVALAGSVAALSAVLALWWRFRGEAPTAPLPRHCEEEASCPPEFASSSTRRHAATASRSGV